jgi:hypothetical protein
MGYANESGYTPQTINEIMLGIMANINTQFGTSYTEENFVGTNFYKYFYALAQRMQDNEVKTSEIFAKLQQYFDITNERISRPVVTNPGLLEKLEDEGYIASVKKPIDADAGKVFVCVDTDETADDYEDVKLAICTLIKDSTAAGVVSQGTESEAIVLSNGQSFDFKFNLPDRIPVLLRLTVTLSENNQVVVGDPDEVKLALLANINARYRLGKNFEPQKYFSILDAPWASQVLLEWSDDDGATYQSTIFDADYDELFDIDLENIELVEA